ncbi:hypothetical protein HJC23_005742 [Cyclotella cryptica]|uniref:Uncharacterized protein n=1 Tax=Cyclotella cryptica TaxID=29204 RepID=A0ABD3QEL8_9STRA|eukprot:CCRYP_006481-RB/>CCRYP_006481-RB protein AED:0.05 eAED:0.05 QI:4745/1/1/1/0.5/0.4/5/54/528
MSTLSDKLVQLTLDIDDKKKTIDLLRTLIEDQKIRHASEATNFEKEMEASLQKDIADSDAALREQCEANELLSRKKAALESRVEEFSVEKKNAEHKKKVSIEAVQRDVAEAKERAHRMHQQQKSEREKAWFNKRLAEIKNITLKGIQPNIDRILRKHREDCDEIKCKTTSSKHKLELQCENELLERIHEFQRKEQQSITGNMQRSDFAHSFMREQEEHASRLKKLKESFNEDEEKATKMYEMELQTLRKENEVTICKLSESTSQHLENDLKNKRDKRRYELEHELEQIGRDLAVSKTKWEDSWIAASKIRIEQQNRQKMKELLEFRESKVNEMIRSSIIEQACMETLGDESKMTAEHNEKLACLHQKISSTQCRNDELRGKISPIAKSRHELQCILSQLEKEFDAACNKLDETMATKERKKKQHDGILKESCHQIERSIDSINRRQGEVKREVARIEEKIKEESRKHNDSKSALRQEHEHQLDDLQHHATESARELDRKLLTLKNAIKEKEVYLSRAQDLMATRYNKH